MPLKLLYITWLDLTRMKGSTAHVNGIIKGLHKLGWRIYLISALYSRKAVRNNYSFPNVTIGVNGTNLFYQLLWQIKLLGYLLNGFGERPDIIYIRAGKSLFIPAAYAIFKNIPYFLEINTLIEMETSTSNRILVPLACFIENWMLRHAAGVFTVTPEIKSFLIARSGQPESKFHVIPNGCDAQLCQNSLKNLKKGNDDGPNIGFLGSFERWQGVETVIKSLPILSREIPKVRFQIGGAGKLEPEYRQLCQSLGVDSLVSFHGIIHEDHILEFMNRCRVMVVPRIGDFDKKSIMAHVGASPIKLFTALGSGCPVVISRLKTFSSFTNCSAILFAEPDNAQNWADTLLRILKMPASQRHELSKEAIEFINEYHTWDVLAQKTANIIRHEVIDLL